MYMQLGILAHIWRPVQEPYNKVHTRLVDGRRHPRRVHFSSQAHLHRAHFLTAPATAAGAMRTFRHGSVPTVHTKRQIPYTAGGLPCRKVRTARPVFAVYTFLRKPFPAVHTSRQRWPQASPPHTLLYSSELVRYLSRFFASWTKPTAYKRVRGAFPQANYVAQIINLTHL